MSKGTLYTLPLLALLLGHSGPLSAEEAPTRPECIAPAKPGGGFDLTCKLLQVSLQESGALDKPMRITYMPGGVGAVAYNAIVAQRPAEAGTVVAFSGGSLLNLAQGVDQRAKMTRFSGFSASNFDHPGVCATIRF
ncbi:hypothetical protein ACW5WA_18740, partial [Aeromonas simiae]